MSVWTPELREISETEREEAIAALREALDWITFGWRSRTGTSAVTYRNQVRARDKVERALKRLETHE